MAPAIIPQIPRTLPVFMRKHERQGSPPFFAGSYGDADSDGQVDHPGPPLGAVDEAALACQLAEVDDAEMVWSGPTGLTACPVDARIGLVLACRRRPAEFPMAGQTPNSGRIERVVGPTAERLTIMLCAVFVETDIEPA